MDEPRKIIIHPSLNRHRLLMGIEREPLILSATLCSLLGFNVWRINPFYVVFVVIVWVVSLFWLRKTTKDDPLSFKVGIRSFEYESWYAARSYLSSKPVQVPTRWKR